MAEASNPDTTSANGPFLPLDPDNIEETLTELESLCMNCHQNGTTKLLLTNIPYFKSVIISSFRCPHCSYNNNELQSASEIEKYGTELMLTMTPPPVENGNTDHGGQRHDDMNRQVIFSEYATVKVPELELEMVAKHHKGDITTVEGIFQRAIDGLSQDQPRRQLENPNDYEDVAKFIFKLEEYRTGKQPFTLSIRDISGNSFISPSPSAEAGQADPQLKIEKFTRTTEENHEVGVFSHSDLRVEDPLQEEDENTAEEVAQPGESEVNLIDQDNQEQLQYEVHNFTLPCPNCGESCDTKMRPTKIPHFKEVIVMATNCEACGYRTNEIKSGSGVEPKGKRFTLEIRNIEDLSRDVLKSGTCSLEIPSLQFEVGAQTMVAKFTTIEGLLKDSLENLMTHNPFVIATDGAPEQVKEKFKVFNEKFEQLLQCKEPYTVILDDPAGNSYVQNLCDPDEDPQLKFEEYERSFEDNEALGLNDMKTENYETEHQSH
jgi:zinc finger protein